MTSSCYVHSGRPGLVIGYIERVYRVWMDVRVFVNGDEFNAECRKIIVHKSQRRQISAGRYIAFHGKRKGVMHLCTCRWTAAEIREAQAAAEKMMATLGLRGE